MFLEQDEEVLRRLLGTETLPESLEEPYARRLKLFHRIHNGPLPLWSLMEVIIEAKADAGPDASPDEGWRETDWKDVDPGTDCLTKLGGAWIEGKYLGNGSFGRIKVEIPGRERPVEANRELTLMRVDRTVLV